MLGEHSDDVLHEWLAMPEEEIRRLQAATVI
jgi:crotonobetainyl-CoA:carnitine CoA-transferase CaiB-like acyl-CoA transferase